MNVKLSTIIYPEEGELQHTYSPLKNLMKEDGILSDFKVDIDKFPININNPLSIECQPSYDGTVNLIISDDENPIRCINTRFTKTESGRFKIINRDQIEQSNIYEENDISLTNLILKPRVYPKLKFKSVLSSGILAGGNYTFYMKYVDGDGNDSDFVAETFQVPIYKGSIYRPNTVSGTLVDEKTDKAVLLRCTELDLTFQKIKIYYTRETSDLNGYRISKAYELLEPFDIKDEVEEILITGHEECREITIDDINASRFEFTSAKTQCQLQNMLFLGNISKTTYDSQKLRNASLFFKVSWVQDEDIGWVNPKDYSFTLDSEYYNPENVCYKTGYWPGEFYRLGVVYILEDGSQTDVFNLRGCRFDRENCTNLLDDESYIKDGIKQNIPSNYFFDTSLRYENTYGVFQNPDLKYNDIIKYNTKNVVPLHYTISLEDKDVLQELRDNGIKGWFFVRQKRIPITLFQGLSLHVDKYSGSPMIWDGTQYYTESFLVNNREGSINSPNNIVRPSDKFFAGKTFSHEGTIGGSVLLSPDVMFIPDLQNSLCGSEMMLEKQTETEIPTLYNRHLVFTGNKTLQNEYVAKLPTIFVREDVPYKIVNDFQFSTRFGSPESSKNFSFFGKELREKNNDKGPGAYDADNKSLLRGIYTSYVGVCGYLDQQCIYSVKNGDYSATYVKSYMLTRGQNHSAFFAISDKYVIPEGDKFESVSIWGGDCYTNTVTIRLNRNFTDPDAPINDYIISPDTWKENYKGYSNMVESTKDDKKEYDKDTTGDYYKINRGDLNSAPMGLWVTFKLLSSYNLGIRSEDRTHVEEMALTGNPRTFYPLNSMSTASNAKISESRLLNLGYSSTVSAREYFEYPNVPYLKSTFSNRIVYSNIQVEDEFKNGYRIFSPIAYQDVDSQYGAIVKLLPWKSNLLCVFEHGIGLIPVNEKALIQSTAGQSIHMYGAGVLSKDITLISGDFGSIWADSIIKTNIGVYGIDTYAKKIWRFSELNGFELLSDMKVQRFLNDNIILSEKDKHAVVALKNVKTHFNAHKGDVMFTFYNYLENVEWNLCYNERLGKWITRYSWTPLCSENINNIYYSLDKKRATLLGLIADMNKNSPVKLKSYKWNMGRNESFETEINLDTSYEDFTLNLVEASTSFFNEKDQEIFISIPKEHLESFCKWIKIDKTTGKLKIDYVKFSSYFSLFFPKTESNEPIGLAYDVFKDERDSDEEYLHKLNCSKAAWDVVLEHFDMKNDLEINDASYEELCEELNNLQYCDGDGDSQQCEDCEDWFPTYEEYLKLYEKYKKELDYDSNEGTKDFQPNLPLFLTVTVDISTTNKGYTPPTPLRKTFVILSTDDRREDERNKRLVNGFYVHGRAGIFDEMNYADNELNNQILPTKWYDSQEPFEFEFVINSPVGLHKIFDNLVIISNNVQPNSIEYTIEGDTYSLFKNNDLFNNNKKRQLYLSGVGFKNAKLNYDTILNQYSLTIHQDCKNIADPKYGRRLGNIQYKEDSWYATIEPLVFDPLLKASPEDQKAKWTSTRIRDKFLKVRVKYTGEDLVIITAIKNLCTLSRA